jgi:hypothetical protein
LAFVTASGLLTYFALLAISLAISRPSWNARDAADRFGASAAPAARISGLAECLWQGAARGARVGSPLPAGVSRLEAGVVEFVFAGGARVRIEGPAEFAPRSGMQIQLTRGRLMAYVPERAHGFTVITPSAEVVDLGTEFGVEVDGEGATDLHVIRGRVELKRLPAAKVPELRGRQLIAGQAIHVDARGFNAAPIALDMVGFHRLRAETLDGDRQRRIRAIAPNQLADLRLWLRADQGLETDAAGRVQSWLDQSGHGYSAAQAESQRRPRALDEASSPGFPAVAFDGIDDYLVGSSLGTDMTTDLSLLVVFRVSKSAPNAGIFSLRDKEMADWNSFSGFAFCQSAAGQSLRVVQAECAAYGPPVPTEHDPLSFETSFGDTPEGAPMVAILTKGHGIATLWLNNVEVAIDLYGMQFPANVIQAHDAGFILGARAESADGLRRAGTGRFGNVEIAEIAFYRRALSAAEAMQLTSYMSTKYLEH